LNRNFNRLQSGLMRKTILGADSQKIKMGTFVLGVPIQIA